MNKDFGSSHSAAREKTHLAWFRDDTIDNWRHRRMYEPVIDALRSTKNDEWVTVGDGRYGLDAIRMQRAGFTNVLPTDISSNMLAESKRRGLIRRYSVENGEALSFGDGRFDYVLCKEALHHSPRPPAMIYELLRVARKGVVLIEPQDHKDRGDKYEEAGNYVYSLSRREMSKLARAANLAAVATKGQNDAFEAGLEFEPAIGHLFRAGMHKEGPDALLHGRKRGHLVWASLQSDVTVAVHRGVDEGAFVELDLVGSHRTEAVIVEEAGLPAQRGAWRDQQKACTGGGLWAARTSSDT